MLLKLGLPLEKLFEKMKKEVNDSVYTEPKFETWIIIINFRNVEMFS